VRIGFIVASLLLFGNSQAAALASPAELSLLIDKIGTSAGTPIIDVALGNQEDWPRFQLVKQI